MEEGSGDLEPLCMNVWNAIIESITCKDAIIHRSHLLDSCCQCYLPSYLRPLFQWWSGLVSGSISDEQRSTEAPNSKFPATSWQSISAFTKPATSWQSISAFTKFTSTSCSKLTARLTLLMRMYKTGLPAVVPYSANSGRRNECQNDRVLMTKQL